MAGVSNLGASRGDDPGAKGPGVLNAAVTIVLVVIVGAFALTVRQPPPPSIAEFAPQAQEQIKEAPVEQSGAFGGEGPGEEGFVAPTPSPPPSIVVPRVRSCVGDPPRQTEDPQSPPCVPYWDGDNGGATSRGVTRDEIRVALPEVGFESLDSIKRLVAHFNKRYQFYGRKLNLLNFQAQGGLISHPDPRRDQGDAIYVDEELKAFASLATGLRWGSEHHYYDELARRRIISIAHGIGSQATEDSYRSFAPYKWGTMPGMDTMLRNTAEFVCNVLAGKAPIYAGGSQSTQPERIFGLIYQRTVDGAAPDMEPLTAGLARCGAAPGDDRTVEDRPSSDAARNGENQMLKMNEEDVTSVICICEVGDARRYLMPAASSQGYFPEWVVTSYINHDVDNGHREAPPDQVRGVIGVTFKNKWNLREDMPWYWAIKDADPSWIPAENWYYHLASRYSSLLLLASGIQLAGPDLNPRTFQEGLFRATFPNPGAGGPPYYQARVGFEGGKHTMMGDAAMFWYSSNTRSTAEPSLVGAVCYVASGKRYSLGRWPSEAQFRQGPCL